jgi:hypothetical protein
MMERQQRERQRIATGDWRLVERRSMFATRYSSLATRRLPRYSPLATRRPSCFHSHRTFDCHRHHCHTDGLVVHLLPTITRAAEGF